MNVKENVFSSEREFKKALRDTLMRATWFELLSTMANCDKIVTFLCLGISIITWVIILKQKIRLRLVNIGEYSPRLRLGECSTIFTSLRRIIVKVAQNSNISVRSLGSNAPFSAGNHAITRGFVR